MKTIEERFWVKVDKKGPDDCWEWTGFKNSLGYGRFEKDGKAVFAHRVAFELTTGEIPPGFCVCHRCDNPACCNPAHLFLGKPKDNNKDMIAKGRRGKCNSKLTGDKVKEIREFYKSGLAIKELSQKYGIGYDTIYSAVTQRTWKGI